MNVAFILILWCFAPAALRGQNDTGLSLRREVIVAGDRLTLADLLPASAPSSLRLEAERVALGDAPQAGAIRLLGASMLRERLHREKFASAISVEGDTTVLRETRVIGLKDVEAPVLREFAARRLPVPAVIDLSAVVAAPDGPMEIKVRNLRYDAAQKCYDLSLTAGSPATQPFLVRVPSDERPPAALEAKSNLPVKVKMRVRPDLPRGSRSLLRISGQGFTATVPVVALDDGITGASVRVEDPSTHHVYLADLTDDGPIADLSYR